MTEKDGIKNCENCIHKDEPAKSGACMDCWNYQLWKNWEPAVGGDKA